MIETETPVKRERRLQQKRVCMSRFRATETEGKREKDWQAIQGILWKERRENRLTAEETQHQRRDGIERDPLRPSLARKLA
ncbi:hypothetical protein CEXT_173441 [Caerostris extrusa]|uniref:Uncharacterized protein n=1 Tax=Caerostris extrusa TaxID=172846 RepID=A0AAV4Y3C1_CAEEX|nr:hypothetical protein CEXT_173441 [Caerostris extrusa]